MHPALPRAMALVTLLQFEPLAAAQESTDTLTAPSAPSTDPTGSWSGEGVLHQMEVADPNGRTIALRIFARDLADPATAVKKFCDLQSGHGRRGPTVGAWEAWAVDTCTRDVMRNLAPTLDRLRGRHAFPVAVPTHVPTEVPTTEPAQVPTDVPTEEPTAVPTQPPALLPTTLLEFQSVLVSANLQKYETTLADAGYYECDDLKEATTVELKELGMKTPEIRRLRKYLERMVELTASPTGLPSVPSSAAPSVRSQAKDCAGVCALHSKNHCCSVYGNSDAKTGLDNESDEQWCTSEFRAIAQEGRSFQTRSMFQFILRYYLWYQESESAVLAHPSLHCLSDPQFISLLEVATAIRIAHDKGCGLDDGTMDFPRLLPNFCGHGSPLVESWFAMPARTRTHMHALTQECSCTLRSLWKSLEALSEAVLLELVEQPFKVLQKQARCLETLSLTSLQFGVQAELFHRDTLAIKGALLFIRFRSLLSEAHVWQPLAKASSVSSFFTTYSLAGTIITSTTTWISAAAPSA